MSVSSPPNATPSIDTRNSHSLAILVTDDNQFDLEPARKALAFGKRRVEAQRLGALRCPARLYLGEVWRLRCRRKRKSRPLLDEVEDGGRAAVIEEGVAALAFDYARRHHVLEGVSVLDFQLLRTIKDMTSHLKVTQCTTGECEQAILHGVEVWPAAGGWHFLGNHISRVGDQKRQAFWESNVPIGLE